MKISALCVLLAGALVAFGCSDVEVVDPDGTGGSGGGGGAAGARGAGDLSVVQVAPADMATDVATDVEVTAELDAALNEATVTSTSFSLARDGDEAVAGTLSVDGVTATFSPEGPLGVLRDYTATLTTEVEAVSGATLAMNETWTFTTRDGQWGDARLLEISNAGDAFDVRLAVGSDGSAMAVWWQSDGTRFNIWANSFTQSDGWGVAEVIETDNANNGFLPQAAIGPDGSALAVWSQTDGTRNNIWANRFTPSSGWSTAELIETDNVGGAFNPRVAIDPDGNAFASWDQSDGTRNNILVNRFTPSAGWGTPEPIETNNAGTAFDAKVAVDANGNAFAVWEQSDGTRFNIWANRYTRSGGWGAAELIETDNAGSASDPQLTVDANGNALAVWEQSDGTLNNVWVNRFTPTGGWGTAELLETEDAGPASDPDVGVDARGNAIAVWEQSDGVRTSVWASRFTPSGGWDAPELLDSDDMNGAFDPKVAVDANGNAIAVWEQSDGTRNNIWASRFTSTGGWDAPELIETDDTGGALDPQVVVDRDGNAVAAWWQLGGTRYNIWANRFE